MLDLLTLENINGMIMVNAAMKTYDAARRRRRPLEPTKKGGGIAAG